MSTVLDPRFKQLQWLDHADREQVYSDLKAEMLKYEKEPVVKVKQESSAIDVVSDDSTEQDTTKGSESPEMSRLPQMNTTDVSETQPLIELPPVIKKMKCEPALNSSSASSDDFFECLSVREEKRPRRQGCHS